MLQQVERRPRDAELRPLDHLAAVEALRHPVDAERCVLLEQRPQRVSLAGRGAAVEPAPQVGAPPEVAAVDEDHAASGTNRGGDAAEKAN